MARKQATAKKRARPRVVAATLAPGLHAGLIELRSDQSYRVRLLDGTVVSAALDDDVDAELARECLRKGRRVIVTGSDRGPLILGALQTSRPIARESDGSLTLSAKKIRLKAEQALVLESGDAVVRLAPDGMVKLEGDRMVVDIGGLVRFLSARVEFP
jgi:hypothetical protein